MLRSHLEPSGASGAERERERGREGKVIIYKYYNPYI